jgi:hypothetical protein
MGQSWPKFDPVAPLSTALEIAEFHSDDVDRVRDFLGTHFTEHVLKDAATPLPCRPSSGALGDCERRFHSTSVPLHGLLQARDMRLQPAGSSRQSIDYARPARAIEPFRGARTLVSLGLRSEYDGFRNIQRSS